MIKVATANKADWGDLQQIFGSRGPASQCWCQRYKLAPRESFRSRPAADRAARFRTQTACGQPRSQTTSGLVAYLDGEPCGWCALEPRHQYSGLVRVFRVPWEGRSEDKADDSVWAITCFRIRTGYRKKGIAQALTHHAVEFARQRGARAIEAYPMLTSEALLEELHVGLLGMYIEAGFTEVSRPGKRRAVVRIDY